MSKNTSISSASNAINKFHIQSDLRLIYKQNFYYDKQDEIDTLFGEYHVPLLNHLNNTALIMEWKQNIGAAAHEKN